MHSFPCICKCSLNFYCLPDACYYRDNILEYEVRWCLLKLGELLFRPDVEPLPKISIKVTSLSRPLPTPATELYTPMDGITSTPETLPVVDGAMTVDKLKKSPKRLQPPRSTNVPPAPINVAEESAIVDIDDSGLPSLDQTVSETREPNIWKQLYATHQFSSSTPSKA